MAKGIFDKTKTLPITLFATVYQEGGKDTGVQLRCRTTEPQLLKQLCQAAYRGEQVTVFLSFKDKAQAIGSLLQHGLVLSESKDGKVNYKWVD